MNMFEEAKSLECMMEMCGMTQKEIGEKIGVSQSYIANKMRLAKHTEEHKRMILEGGLTERHARTLLRIDDENMRGEVLKKVIERRLNVAQCEALVDFYYEREAPRRIGNGDKLTAIGAFRDNVKASLERLISLGIEAREKISYIGDELYITIAINERL